MPEAPGPFAPLPRGLHGVAMDERSAIFRDSRYFGKRLQHADLVVAGHHAHEQRLVGDRVPERVEIDEPVRFDAKIRRAKPVALERTARIQNRAMLGRHRHNMTPISRRPRGDTFDREVVRFGRPARDAFSKTRHDGSAPCSLACSTALAAFHPNGWFLLDALPKCSVKNGSIASSTLGSTGVVAWESR